MVGLVVLPLGRAGAAEPTPRAEPTKKEAQSETEVRVDGVLNERAAADPTAASTVLRREALSEPGLDAARALARVPGVQTTRAGSSADVTTLSLRGSTAAEVPVYLAGVRIQDEVTGVADLSRFPLWMLDRIEVYRGTSPEVASRFGMAGVVLLEPRLPRAPEVRAGLELGSWNSQSAFVGGTMAGGVEPGTEDRGTTRAASSFSYRVAHADNDFNYHDDGGTSFDPSDDRVVQRQNADFDSQEFWSISNLTLPTAHGEGRAELILSGFSREQGVTGLSAVPAQQARMSTTRELGGVRTSVPCASSRDGCTLSLSSHGVLQHQLTSDPWNELGLGADWVALGSERFETRASLRARPSDAWLVGADAALENARLRLDEPGLQRTRATERILTATALTQARFETLENLGLVRVSCLDVQGVEAGRSTTFDSCLVEGRWGSSLELWPGLALRANVSRAVRPPTLGERYGVSAGARGNPDLLPEQGWSLDAGFNYTGELGQHGKLALEAFGFARFAEQLIAYQRSALGYVRPYNVAQARTLGAEVALESIWLQHLRVRAQLTALDPRDTSAERMLANDLIPLLSRLTAGGEFEAFVRGDEALSRAAFTVYLRYRGGRVADPAGLIVIGDQLITDLALTFIFLQNRVSVRSRLENVFDVAQFDVVGYPLPGRSFYSSLELSY